MLSSIYPTYTLNLPKYWFVRDEPVDKLYSPREEKSTHASMLFHVSSGDYITTLVTILRFFEESVYDNKVTEETRELHRKTIRNVINDLLYLDEHCTIVPKDK